MEVPGAQSWREILLGPGGLHPTASLGLCGAAQPQAVLSLKQGSPFTPALYQDSQEEYMLLFGVTVFPRKLFFSGAGFQVRFLLVAAPGARMALHPFV